MSRKRLGRTCVQYEFVAVKKRRQSTNECDMDAREANGYNFKTIHVHSEQNNKYATNRLNQLYI